MVLVSYNFIGFITVGCRFLWILTCFKFVHIRSLIAWCCKLITVTIENRVIVISARPHCYHSLFVSFSLLVPIWQFYFLSLNPWWPLSLVGEVWKWLKSNDTRTYIRLRIGQNLKGKFSRVISHFLHSRDHELQLFRTGCFYSSICDLGCLWDKK